MKFKLLFSLMLFLLHSVIFAQLTLLGTTYGIGGHNGSYFRLQTGDTIINYQYVMKWQTGYSPTDLLLANNGKFYGTTTSGGINNVGVLYEFDPVSSKYTKLFDFDGVNGKGPQGGLIQSSNGKLYGMSQFGGTNNKGTLYEYDILSNVLLKKIDFDGVLKGSNPVSSLYQANNGNLYGMTTSGGVNDGGIIFEFNTITNGFTKKFDFDTFSGLNGNAPQGSLIEVSLGKLYGMTYQGGVSAAGIIFEYDLLTGSFNRKYSFNGFNGARPKGTLYKASNGKLYGTTEEGGTDTGVMFEYDPILNNYSKKVDFSTSNTGSYPKGSVVEIGGKLYGMTKMGGVNSTGVIFEYDLLLDTCLNKFDFSTNVGNSSPYGKFPLGSFIVGSNNKLYGTVSTGGDNLGGILFEFDPSSNACIKRFEFDWGGAGCNPNGALIHASNDKFFGTTQFGGVSGFGVLYEYKPSDNSHRRVLDFNSMGLSQPLGSLIEASNGKIYGTSSSGGIYGGGALFEFDPATDVFVKKADFNSIATGASPLGSLTQATNGKLYGVTLFGGIYSLGVIFEYDILSNSLVKKMDLPAFASTIYGKIANASLKEASNGKIYGTMSLGGVSNLGVIFEYDPSTNVYSKKQDFGGLLNGSQPQTGLCLASNGKFYGTTKEGGVNNFGVLFEYDPLTNVLINKFDFNGAVSGSAPFGSLIQSANGKLYGTTSTGGISNKGTLFEYDLALNSMIKKLDFKTTNGANPVTELIEVCQSPFNITAITGPSQFCKSINNNFIYSVPNTSNALSFNWSLPLGVNIIDGGSSDSITLDFSSLTSGNYTISVAGQNFCGQGQELVLPVSISPIPTVNITESSGNICVGSSNTLNVTGATTYTWNTGATTSSININPPASTIYTVTGTDLNNCSNTQTVSVTVDNTCADVWPGDANSDGVADNLDVLELGLHYTQTGTPRTSTSNSWQSYVAINWAGTITSGKNLNHSDCNGDGVIDANDTLAIYLNYGLTHAFKPAQQTTTNEQLTIMPDQPMVSKGQWGTASVYLGTSASPISTINGLAFTLHFDQSLIEPNSIQIDYPVSFLNTGQNLNFRKQHYFNGALYAATTHTNNSNINGYGKIAVIHYQIKSSLVHDTVLAFNLVQATQSSANGSLMPLTSGSASVTAIGATVGINELSSNTMVAIYPNPANQFLVITSTQELQKVELVSVTGQVMLSENVSGNNSLLKLDSMVGGIYLINVYSNGSVIKREKIILQK